MAEYIEKLQAQKTVRNIFKKHIDLEKPSIINAYVIDINADIQKALNEISTDYVMEIVRCKDCQHSKYKPIVGMFEEGEQTTLLYCTMFVNGQHIYEEDFCSYGERKAEE